MKKLKKYIVENYNSEFSFSELMSEGIPKLFLKIEAVKKDIAKLEAERKKESSTTDGYGGQVCFSDEGRCRIRYFGFRRYRFRT
jgi:hypothetical protein